MKHNLTRNYTYLIKLSYLKILSQGNCISVILLFDVCCLLASLSRYRAIKDMTFFSSNIMQIPIKQKTTIHLLLLHFKLNFRKTADFITQIAALSKWRQLRMLSNSVLVLEVRHNLPIVYDAKIPLDNEEPLPVPRPITLCKMLWLPWNISTKSFHYRYTCKTSSLLGEFESYLFPIFTEIIQRDVTGN